MPFSASLIPNVEHADHMPPIPEDRYVGIPRMIYGMAFKGDRSALLVEQALNGMYTFALAMTHKKVHCAISWPFRSSSPCRTIALTGP